MRATRRGLAAALAVAGWMASWGCTPRQDAAVSGIGTWQPLDPPSAVGALAPDLWTGAGDVYLSWLEPVDVGGAAGHRLVVAGLDDVTWRTPVEVARGDDFFANWADLPGGVVAQDGSLYAHWLAKLGTDTYAYGVQLAHSTDRGVTWRPLGLLHDDASATEHGFVAYQALADGSVQASWLDGRGMADGGPMQLRGARMTAGEVGPSAVLADRVCECCATDMTLATDGPVVVVRGRTDDEIRDIWTVRATGDGWASPTRVHDDGWQIAGCPVNGPAIDAREDTVVVGWFTAAGGPSVVRLAFSTDGGAHFAAPTTIDAAEPLGRVDVVLDGAGAWLSWLARSDAGAAVRVVHVALDGTVGPVETVAETAATRVAGVPRMIRQRDRLLITWVDVAEASVIRLASRSLVTE